MNMIKFAALVSWLQWSMGSNEKYFVAEDLETFQESINNLFDKPYVDRAIVPTNLVDDLLRTIKDKEHGFIPAIKAYRMITNAGIKEAKEAIEKYR